MAAGDYISRASQLSRKLHIGSFYVGLITGLRQHIPHMTMSKLVGSPAIGLFVFETRLNDDHNKITRTDVDQRRTIAGGRASASYGTRNAQSKCNSYRNVSLSSEARSLPKP
ncbi:uncharacterized protein LAJ45_10374 [Morchella importuna]|uniref:uncharacterized protein n=1 Tax=Morchella importuna TaxID=1174673 RepID=UPI001E8CD427|nr:uncharacterized protein LAJ45_10374 [Morchella importuna]KAH8145574.1 hypothetical protein LAJ45_10374 [Morchella importuna]